MQHFVLRHRAVLMFAFAVAGTLVQPARAETRVYSFSGLYNIAGGTQPYTGSFTVAEPVLTTVRPPQAPDMSLPHWAGVWAGSSQFYTGGIDIQVTFASTTTITASTMGIVVNNTTFSGSGSPYPEGLSVQLYPSGITLTGPTREVCATPTGECGPDDDPLYHDATQAAIMRTTGIYFAFYMAPLATEPGMPVLTDAFGPGNAGLGIFSVQGGLNTTALTSFNGFSSTVTAVPEPASAWLLMSGAVALAARRMQKNRENGA